jgi:DNA-binding HxlR family transcriptional regulator
MSSELKELLHIVALEDFKREEADFEKGLCRYKSLLLKVAREKKWDVLTSFEGTNQRNSEVSDLKVLEKAELVAGQTKYTHRNAYREYKLTAKGAELAEKLSNEH